MNKILRPSGGADLAAPIHMKLREVTRRGSIFYHENTSCYKFCMKEEGDLMSTITHCAETVQRILEEETEQLAREVGFIERERVISGADFVQSLILGWLQEIGRASCRERV